MPFKRSGSLLLVLVLFAIAAIGCGQSSPAPAPGGAPAAKPPTTLKIGALFPFSGSLAQLGQENFTGFDIAREIATDKGWVKGVSLELVKADVPDSKAAQSEANRLITQQGLQLLVGTYSSGLSVVASKEAERNNVLYWEISGTAAEITAPGKQWTFRVNAPASQLGTAAADFVAQQAPDVLKKPLAQIRLALAHEDSAFGTNIGGAIAERARSAGLNIVETVTYSAQTSDLSSLILKLKSATPDVVIATSYLNDAILFSKQAKELGFRPPILIGTSAGFSDKGFVTARGADAEGVLSTDPPSAVNPASLTPEARELLADFTKRFQTRLGRDPGPVATLGFVGGVVLFRDVLPKAKSFSPADVRAAALALDLPAGSLPNGWGVKFDGPDSKSPGQNQRVFATLNQWQGGALKLVVPANLSVTRLQGLPLASR